MPNHPTDLVVALIVLSLLTAAWLVFAAIEIGGLALPHWHTVSFLAHNYLPLRIALLAAVAFFWLWLFWHLGQPVAK